MCMLGYNHHYSIIENLSFVLPSYKCLCMRVYVYHGNDWPGLGRAECTEWPSTLILYPAASQCWDISVVGIILSFTQFSSCYNCLQMGDGIGEPAVLPA